jgi:sigma-B regulation protein RsbU (phosphoserine phosphatase)
MATEIQSSMLPNSFPPYPNRKDFDLYASMDPAKEVGGDFYDFFMMDDDHLVLVIADVSDKGVPAALFMMSAKNIINYRARMGGTPAEILTSVNAQLSEDNAARMFVTVWLGILELSTGRLTCTNAGHEYPFIRHPDGPFERLDDKHGIIMGIMRKVTYQEYEIALKPGSKVFVYTDGLPEASNAKEEQFGMDRIAEALNAAPDGAPRELLDNVQRAVDGFVDGAKQFDDLTMLCLEYRGADRAE